MTATANLTALRAAALAGDRVAMLLLADLAEDRGDDARADAWRWLADPPVRGWELRVCGLLLAGVGRYRRDVEARGYRVRATCARGTRLAVWGSGQYWRWEAGHKSDARAQPWARGACLSACRQVLAG
jgi:hypothetical protein